MSFEKELERMEEIGNHAVSGKSDEEIAKLMNTTWYNVRSIRLALGVRKIKPKIRVAQGEWKKAIYDNERDLQRLVFILDNKDFADLGLNSSKQVKFSGETKNGKLILSFEYV